MARYPGAIWRPIPENSTQPLVRITQVIMHVRAGTGDSLYGLWTSPGNGLESHFYVRYDGTVEQYMDTARSADANLTANYRADGTGAMSIETEGLAPGTWTEAQLAALANLARWANRVHSVPLRVCPGPNDPGIGYHIMFGTPGPWTPVAKSCPGPERIRQFHSIIMPRLAGAEEDDMPLSDADVTRVADAVWRKVSGGLTDPTHSYLPPLHNRMAALEGRVVGMQAAVAQLATGNADPAAVEAAIEAAMRRVLGSLDGSGNA